MENTAQDAPEGAPARSEGSDGPGLCVFAPWPVVTVTVEAALRGGDDIHVQAGGQGVWVARMAASLGARVTLVGPFGGAMGRAAMAMLRGEGIAVRPVAAKSSNGGYVHDRRGGERCELAQMPPARLDRHEADDLLDVALTEGLRCGVVVLTGVREGEVIDPALYGVLSRDLAANGVEVVADLAGEALAAIEEGLGVLKISHEEMLAGGLAEGGCWGDLARGMEGLAGRARDVVVSCAERGTLARLGDRFWLAEPPSVTARDSTGAGDSMTGALAAAKARGLPAEEALRLATAAGALNATRRGRGTGAAADVEVLAGRVALREVDPAALDRQEG